MEEFLQQLNQDNFSLIDLAREWIAVRWGIKENVAPEQIAAVLLMEASTYHDASDESVVNDKLEWATNLRRLAFVILKAAGHYPPVEMCRRRVEEDEQEEGHTD